MYRMRIRILILAALLLLLSAYACADTPVTAASYQELQTLLSSCKEGDTILIEGSISGGSVPLSTPHTVILRAMDEDSSLSGLRLRDASIILSGISIDDSLVVDGVSHVQLDSGTSVSGADGLSALHFSGSGTLIIGPSCRIDAAPGETGVTIEHNGGEFFGSIEGDVHGGDDGGSGVVVSPLTSSGALMIDGSIRGGSGQGHGGHALNLYGLSGNAYVTIAGDLRGGDGTIGGNGIQLVSASDNVNVGVDASVKGGSGEVHAGDAMILMNAAGASTISLSGHFAGGDASDEGGSPGTSLQLVGDSSASRARILDCILEDGSQYTGSAPEPNVTPLPEIIEEPFEIATPDEAVPAEAESEQPEQTDEA